MRRRQAWKLFWQGDLSRFKKGTMRIATLKCYGEITRSFRRCGQAAKACADAMRETTKKLTGE